MDEVKSSSNIGLTYIPLHRSKNLFKTVIFRTKSNTLPVVSNFISHLFITVASKTYDFLFLISI